MAANISPQNTDRPIWDDTQIYITKNTVKFGSEIYQFRNVTGFGISPVKTEKFPIQWILGLFVIGLVVASYFNKPELRAGGIIMAIVAIIQLILNTFMPEKYGLKLYLNSGSPLPIFVTTDMKGLEKVVYVLYNFMESNAEGSYVVYSSDRSIRIEGSVGGSVTAGDIGGSSSSQVGRDVSRND
ncbi:hypothetical protein [Microcoleus sp. B4-D4]|uniref:hypothetical protein n=1 Tax=Microcoleus sp. B4-D4 TaxID=2818667 RepID=UPI002FCF0AFA